MQGAAFLYEKKCHMCGKGFVVLHVDMWTYKRSERYFCSYKCMRAFDKRKEERRRLNDQSHP